MSMPATVEKPKSIDWRTPTVVVVCGCLIAMISFGPRSSLGFFLTPLSQTNHWGRDVFAFAVAIQNLLWGIGQPFAGAIADRFGTNRVLCVGAVLYALGLAIMSRSTTPEELGLSAGVLIGLGLSGCSFNIVLGAFGKLLPEKWRSLAFGAGTAAGSFGQFLYSPIAVALMDKFGWQQALLIFAGVTLFILPLSLALATPVAPVGETTSTTRSTQPTQSARHAFAEAFGHRSYVLLVLGFFTCGFQLAFITVHLPSYLIDRGLSAEIGGWTLAVIGMFNIVGSLGSGWLSNAHAEALFAFEHLFYSRGGDCCLHCAAGNSDGDFDLWGSHRAHVAFDRSAHLSTGRSHVRHALAGNAFWLCLFQPSGRRFSRRADRRHSIRADWFV